MKFTGERFIPDFFEGSDDEIVYEHINRYTAISKQVENKTILDAACGAGYGTAILAQTASKAYGIDISEESINFAKNKYQTNEKVEYIQSSVEKLPFKDHFFDIIISYETIEHIDEKKQHDFLKEIKRTLKDDGCLVISTPDKYLYSDINNYKNEYHIKEFYHNEFFNFLNTYFKNISFYYQNDEIVNLIYQAKSKDLDINTISDLNINGKYIVAVCSDKEIEDGYLSSGFILNNTLKLIKNRVIELQDEVEEKNQWAFSLNKTISELEKSLSETKESVSKLQEDVQSKEEQEQNYLETISELEKSLSETKESVSKLQEDVQSKEEQEQNYLETISELEKSLSETKESVSKLQEDVQSKEEQEQNYLETISELEKSLSETKESVSKLQEDVQSKEEQEQNYLETISELEKSLSERMSRIVELQDEVEEKNQWAFGLNDRIKELEGISNIYHQILSSNGWKLLSKYYSIKELAMIMKNSLLHPFKLYKVTDKYSFHRVLHHIKQGNYAYVLERMGYYIKTESSKIELDLMQAAHVDEVLEFPTVKNPKVSIVIPVYNQFDYTYNCLKSILEHTEGIAYEIIIADDVSNDATINIKHFVKNINVVRNKKNLGFLLNCNNAAKQAKGEYVFFLNNDTNVQKDWLSTLLETIEKDKTIGMVGSKLVYADGRQQEAGGIIWNDASGWNFGRLDDPEKPEYNYVKEVDYISGAAIMIRKELWNEIGGFDERYVPAYYEDSDLAFEVRKHGYKVVLQPKSIVVHFEGISNGTDTSTGIKKYQVVNNEKFFEKWKDVLEKEHFPNAQDVFLARDRSKDKKHILIIDHYVPFYDKDAGSRTMWQYLFLLKELGYNITFVGDNFYKHEPYTSILENAGIEILYGGYYYHHFDEWLKTNGQYFDFVYLLRPHIAIKYIDKIKKNTSAKVFYNGTDFHFLRMQREYEISKDKSLLNQIKDMEEKEVSLFEKSDCVLTISEYEKEYFEKRFPNWNIRVIPTFIYKEKFPLSKNNDFAQRKNILFVGGFTHTPNVEGVKWFLQNIWPIIIKTNSNIKFIIVGSNVPDEIKAMEDENIIIKGFVEDIELENLYNQIKLVVAPLTFGAGVKGKIIEAVCHAIPTVTTSIGAEGIVENENILFVEDSPEKFAKTVLSIYSDNEKCSKVRDEQIKYAKKYFSSESVKELMQNIFQKDNDV
ncbi:glycosyltransferase [Sulfurimonas sp. NW7]|uniref:glycosyltransferase n=1 Tax=Sulfurimonas sp. NW7 TaxID=2922727 RepID=UPI003DA8F30A